MYPIVLHASKVSQQKKQSFKGIKQAVAFCSAHSTGCTVLRKAINTLNTKRHISGSTKALAFEGHKTKLWLSILHSPGVLHLSEKLLNSCF